MKTETISSDFARRLELSEVEPFFDQWEAMPAHFAQQFGFGKQRLGDVAVLTSAAVPAPLFNRLMGLGLSGPATERLLDEALAIFHAQNIRSFIVHVTPHNQPPQLVDWLRERGLTVVGGWDRIYREAEPLAYDGYRLPGHHVEKVTAASVEEWAQFLLMQYGMPPFLATVLHNIAGRPGWHHYLLREGNRLIAARSQYIHADGTAWWGVEAPVPGWMTPRFDLDHHLGGEMIGDGLKHGATLFVAEIEKPQADLDHDGYRLFAALGFKRAYFRSNYGFAAAH